MKHFRISDQLDSFCIQILWVCSFWEKCALLEHFQFWWSYWASKSKVIKNRVFDHFFCTFKALYSLRSETNQKIPPTFFVDLLKTNQKMYNLSLLSLKPRKLLNKNWFFKPYPEPLFFKDDAIFGKNPFFSQDVFGSSKFWGKPNFSTWVFKTFSTCEKTFIWMIYFIC